MPENTKRAYPIRVDISQQGAGREATPVPTAYRVASAVGDGLAWAGNRAADAIPGVALARVLNQAVNSPTLRSATEGVFGLTPGALAAAPVVAAAKTVPKVQAETVPQNAVAAASSKTATPQDRAMAAIDTILSQPFTMREFETATGALPQVASSSAKVSNKDKVFGTASGIADTLYQAELGQAAKLTGEAKDAAVLKATENYQRNIQGLLGVDASKQALADAIAEQQAGN